MNPAATLQRLALLVCSIGLLSCQQPPAPSCPPTSPTPTASSAVPATSNPSGEPARVIVVGGGLAGLVTAYELEKRGIRSHILEANDSFGGRVATAYYGKGNELYSEYGMQEMWASNPLTAIARELKVPLDEKVEKPFSSVVIDGKLRPLGDDEDAYFNSFLTPPERKALKGWMAQSKDLLDKINKHTLPQADVDKILNVSFATWVESFKLPKHAYDWIRLTLECELAADWETFSGLIGLQEFAVFFGEGEPNYHVKGGNSNLIKALVNAIHGDKDLSANVMRVDRSTKDGKITARVSYMKNQRLETIEAERVVLAVPFVRLHQIEVEPPLSDEKWQGILTLMRGQYTVVHMLIDKAANKLWKGEDPFPILTQGLLGVVYGVMHESPPSEPLEVFSLLIHGPAANAFHMVPRDIKMREVLAGLDKMWPGFSKYVKTSTTFTYHPASIAVWPPGRSPLDERGQKIREPEMGLYLAGDWTYSGHSDGAVKSGIKVAEQIARELGAHSAH